MNLHYWRYSLTQVLKSNAMMEVYLLMGLAFLTLLLLSSKVLVPLILIGSIVLFQTIAFTIWFGLSTEAKKHYQHLNESDTTTIT